MAAKTRVAADYYPTPAWCVHRLVEALNLPAGRWLEPAAGDGAIIRAINRQDVEWTATELRPEEKPGLLKLVPEERLVFGDFLQAGKQDPRLRRRFDVAITNPPYRQAEAFVRACQQRADVVVCLLRLGFASSQERQPFLRHHAPDIYVLPNRPCFVHGTSDHSEYAWMVWSGAPKSVGSLRVLGLTPAHVRAGTVDRIDAA